MKLKNAIQQFESFNFLVSKLDIKSDAAKRDFFESEIMIDADSIETALCQTEQMQKWMQNSEYQHFIETIQRKLSQIQDIQTPISHLEHGFILSDIELFEIKNFCLFTQDISDCVKALKIEFIDFPDVTPILELLDPESFRMSNFYIYDSYSTELQNLRTIIKDKQNHLQSLPQIDMSEYQIIEKEIHDLFSQAVQIEDDIRAALALQLYKYSKTLETAINATCYLDILMAKTVLSLEMNLHKPIVSTEKTVYRGMMNPFVQHLLNKEAKIFQPIDIQLLKTPTLITGSNMAGKSILLQTIGLQQYLFQFGFFVAAEYAQICIVDAVMTCMETQQNVQRGLSSFAVEILCINDMILNIRSGKKMLLLIDEPAHTTNPSEGNAIVNSILMFMYNNKVQSVITTHFAEIVAPCKRLRVKGFIAPHDTDTLTPDNINNFMDYSLMEIVETEIPMEALKIAKLLNVDSEFLQIAQDYLS
jgi:DNA mismatch repair ATPase MutS